MVPKFCQFSYNFWIALGKLYNNFPIILSLIIIFSLLSLKVFTQVLFFIFDHVNNIIDKKMKNYFKTKTLTQQNKRMLWNIYIKQRCITSSKFNSIKHGVILDARSRLSSIQKSILYSTRINNHSFLSSTRFNIMVELFLKVV